MDYFHDLLSNSPQTISNEDSGHKAKRNKSFLENVKSFSSKEWRNVPPLLYPNICSLYGWKCTRQNCLNCTMCGASLLIRLPPVDSEDYLTEVSKHYELLSSKHEPTCSYRESSMPEELLFLPAIPAEEHLEFVLSQFRAGKSEEIAVILSPGFENRVEEYDGLVDWLIRKAIPDIPSRNDKKVMLLILSGWKILRKQKIECEQCFRLLGLWHYSCDTEPEPKRLSLEECLAQRDEFVNEFSQTQSHVDYPATDAERYSDTENDEEKDESNGKSGETIKTGERSSDAMELTEMNAEPSSDSCMTVSRDDAGVTAVSSELEVQSVKRQRIEEEKPKLDPLAEHFPWCRYVFGGTEGEQKVGQPSWQQRVDLLNEVMIRQNLQKKPTRLVSVGALLDSALFSSNRS